MNTKLTLRLNEEIIEKAKAYAKEKNMSLSDLIERYLQMLTRNQKSNRDITPLVKSLSGIIDLPKSKKLKKEYTEYLINKYK